MSIQSLYIVLNVQVEYTVCTSFVRSHDSNNSGAVVADCVGECCKSHDEYKYAVL